MRSYRRGNTIIVEGNEPDVRFRVVDGVVELWEAKPRSLPPQPIPDDFDPEQERRRARQGGCCGQPTE